MKLKPNCKGMDLRVRVTPAESELADLAMEYSKLMRARDGLPTLCQKWNMDDECGAILNRIHNLTKKVEAERGEE